VKRGLCLLPLLLLSLVAASCGGDPDETIATFTSDVMQREICRVTGDSEREACTREIMTQRVRVTLLEDKQQRVWLTGLTRQSTPGRSLLGTRDQLGGYLFYDERVQTNANTGCVLTEELTLALQVDPEADAEAIGADDCIALVGRETRVTTTSPECDDVNDPAQQLQRIVRRRWERAPGCSSDRLAASGG
jgi:hypothetical protein